MQAPPQRCDQVDAAADEQTQILDVDPTGRNRRGIQQGETADMRERRRGLGVQELHVE